MPRRSNAVKKQLVEVMDGPLEPDQEMLETIGKRLYGKSWQSPMARDLGISRRSVERWRFGMFKVSGERWLELIDLIRKKRAALAALEREVEAYVGEQRAA